MFNISINFWRTSVNFLEFLVKCQNVCDQFFLEFQATMRYINGTILSFTLLGSNHIPFSGPLSDERPAINIESGCTR